MEKVTSRQIQKQETPVKVASSHQEERLHKPKKKKHYTTLYDSVKIESLPHRFMDLYKHEFDTIKEKFANIQKLGQQAKARLAR